MRRSHPFLTHPPERGYPRNAPPPGLWARTVYGLSPPLFVIENPRQYRGVQKSFSVAKEIKTPFDTIAVYMIFKYTKAMSNEGQSIIISDT